ncbi:Na/Pi-cotransporter II-related protein [Desulfarculus baarsii DSM 2075]|uniref:Na/Pi-cotransporter II-related protein n=1 Tax=Desulfarculus baarsii (strain ATCC 33931 / DSM 2075 / LMG 7858 / VKM B-1802 / 2st14) TaxID=644282 RepID=E1QJC3_DESB2|nr:Na/Pi cotransporter family protein [Desulfarculus baarsii]ADK85666.1 Na/Pi-cotransporter II-related protein [Desulfarculus baarsii DSM 2075]
MDLVYTVAFQAMGGLGLFLFGMKLMSEGLQRVAGDRLRSFLEMVSTNRVVGALTGTLVTAVVQSSSLTTVTVVGFVNAGLLTLTQAMGVILGANVGTTMTAQIIAFDLTAFAPVAIFIGVGIRFFAKRRRWRDIGEVILGFGMLFFGMEMMKDGFKPLRDHPDFNSFFLMFDAKDMLGVILCVVSGAALTMLLQSSSATVGITMALASQGLLTFPGAVALILGENIGTTITAELASIGGTLTARQAARAHTMFNVIGVCIVLTVFRPFVGLVEWFTMEVMASAPVSGANVGRYIANSHTMFNVLNATFFLFALPLLVKAAMRLTRGGKNDCSVEELGRACYLDSRYVDNPSVALTQARDEAVRMGNIAQEMYRDVTNVMFNRKLDLLSRWRQREEALDRLQREITEFLVKVSQGNITEAESREIASLLRMVNNVERVGDAVENVAELVEEMIENNLHLAEQGQRDYREIRNKVANFLELVVRGMAERDREIMEQAQAMEDEIDLMRERMRDDYLGRLRSGVCTVDPGLIFIDMLTNFEKIGDYSYNIAQAVAGKR